MTRLLVADDEDSIRDLLAMGLRYEGFEVEGAATGTEALRAAERYRPDVILLDVMMPDLDGFEVCRRLVADGHRIPVIFLTAKRELPDRLTGLTIGADDYVTKPFSFEELVARIRIVLRRAATGDEGPSRLRVGDLVIDEDTREVWRQDTPIELTATEFNLLHHLASNARRVLSKGQILDAVWQYDFDGGAAVVETFMYCLRKKVDCFEPPILHTVRGVGYVLRPPAA